jgi:hypothetical protein
MSSDSVFFLARDRKNAVCDFQTDIFLIEPGQVRGDPHLFVRLVDIDLGPAKPVHCPGWPERGKIEPAKHVVEHAIHLAMQCKKRMDVGTTLEADLAPLLFQGMRSLMAMVYSSFNQATSAADKAAAEVVSVM